MSLRNNNRQSQDGYFQFSHLTPIPTKFEDSHLHRILGKETPSLANTSILGLKINSVNIHDSASELHANFGGVEILLSNWIWNSTMQMPHW